MVDFKQRFHNTDKFRQAALHFLQYGTYTDAPRGTSDYVKYWDQETERCLNGYTAEDGEYITGYHYFYLNYSPIYTVKVSDYIDRYGIKRQRRERSFGFPSFWDYDAFYFYAIEDAELAGQHMAVMKARKKGYSFKGASMLVRNYEFIPGSKNFAIASEQKFLIGDGLLTKAWQIMDFVDKNTAWAKQRLKSTAMERTSGFKVKDEFGKETEQGYQSSIIGITLKNDPERIRGTRGKLFLWEEAGKFENLQEAWSIARASLELDDGTTFGAMQIMYGTGGTEGCLMAGSKLYDVFGNLTTIENISEGMNILSYDTLKQKVVEDKVTHIGIKRKPCIQISTKQYRDLQCSEDHLLYASNRYDCNECRIWEWLEASELKPGDLVAIPQNTSVFSNETIFDPYLIGLLIGDGSYVKGSNPILFNCDQEILNYVANNYETVDCKRSHVTKDGRLFKALRINKIRDVLRNLGIYGQTKLNKRLPEKIFSCSKHDCCELLAGLFDTDGCIRLGKSYGNRLPNSSALITTISIELAKQIRDLLQKIGVHASIQKKKPTKRSISRYKVVHDTYNVEIVDKQSLINLYLNVHPKIKYKQKALETIYESVKNRQRWRKNNFEYETIKSITNLGVNIVYDISTEKYHNYIAEGFINHNCAFDGLKDAFYHPSSYNIYEFPNIWDEDVDENSKCAFFVPQWANMEGFDEDGNQKYMDKDGNSLRDIAIRECVKQRKIVQEGKGDQQLLDRYVAERPLTPAEAMLELGGNIFPRKLLLNQLSRLRTNTKLQSMKHVVDLRWDGNGGVEAVEKKSGDITTYPLKNGEKPEGSIVIWEYPITDPPYGLYIAGCLPPGEKVLTQRGLINVEDVTLDDKLIGRKGQQVRIKNLQRYNKKDENIYEIRPCGSFRSTKFTGEHPIWTKNRGWVLAKNLNIDDTLEIPNKYKHTNTTIKDWWTPKLFYFFGLWLGDGFVNINKNAYNIYVSIGNDEVELSQYYQYLIKELFDRSACLAHKNKEQTRVFTHKKLATFLTDNFGKTAYHKRVPEWVKTAPNNLRRAFIQGYLDSDGSVFYDNGKVRANFTSVNLELLEDIQDILYGLEIRNSIVIHQKECKNRFGSISLQSYRINIARCDTIKLTYDRVFDSRKQKILKFSGISSCKKSKIQFDEDNILLKINNINIFKYSGIVYNFECETHEYMVRNILTHNCDPYDMNESGTNSLGSVIIFKRFKAGEAWTDVIVAEYSGRPATADEFYENVRKLLLFYNARCLYENEKIGIYQHFINKHCDYLLADQPDKVIAQIFRDSKVNRKKGCHMTKQVRQYAEEKINEWLREEYEPGHPNLERIYSEPLLEELIMNNGERNVDRVIALCMVMIFREELYQVKVQANKDENKQVQLFDMPLFGSQWWSETPQEDDVPIFTF